MIIEADHRLAFAAGTDAGNRSMRKDGRTAWSHKDRLAAYAAYEKIMGTTEAGAMITVELEPEELHVLIVTLRQTLSDSQRLGIQSPQLKTLCQRIEYLEGLK